MIIFSMHRNLVQINKILKFSDDRPIFIKATTEKHRQTSHNWIFKILSFGGLFENY